MALPIAEYFFDGNGNDSVGNSNLALSNAGGNLSYVSDAEGSGIQSSTSNHNDRLQIDGLDVVDLGPALEGRQKFSIVLKTSNFNAAYPLGIAFIISANGGQDIYLYESDVGTWAFSWGEHTAVFGDTGTIIIDIDTTQATAANRAILYRDGVALGWSNGNTPPPIPQNYALSGFDHASAQFTVMNNHADTDPPSTGATIKYLGFFDDVLGPSIQSDVYDALELDDDASPLSLPTLSFTVAAALSNASSSGFDVGLTTSLNATIDIVITESATQPDESAFDAATFGGAATGFSVYSETITGLNPETTYYAHVRASAAGQTSIYAAPTIATLAVQNAIISINAGEPIRYGQTGIVVLWDGGATGTTATTINGVTQTAHAVVSDTESTFDFTAWPATLYGQTETLDIGGVQFETPPILPPDGYAYYNSLNYNAATPGTLPADVPITDGSQGVYDQEIVGGAPTVIINPQSIVSFTESFDGDITAAIVDIADNSHSDFITRYFALPNDIIPDQFALPADEVDAEPGEVFSGSFQLTGVDTGQTITIPATGSLEVSADGVTYGPYFDMTVQGDANDMVFWRIAAGALDSVRTGGISINGVVDTISVTTRPASIPTITTHPSAQSVTAGVNASFTAAATNVSTWQWQKDTAGNGTFIDISGETATTLSYPTTIANNTDQFRARATSPEGGIVYTDPATLTVIAAAATLTTDILQDRNGAIVSTAVDIEVWTVKASGQVSTLLWSGQTTTSATGVAVVTNNAMGTPGDYVDVAFPGLNNSESVLRYQLA